jgi:hypothetical protein
MRPLPLQSLFPSLLDPTADHAALSAPSAAAPAWLTRHQDVASAALTRARQGVLPAHAPVLAPPAPPIQADRHALLKQRLTLAAPLTRPEGVAAGESSAPRTGPALLVMVTPPDSYQPLVEFLLMLKGLNARHVVVLGDMSEWWAQDRGNPARQYSLGDCHGSRVYADFSSPVNHGASWLRDVRLAWERPSAEAPDTPLREEHGYRQLQLACGTSGTLGPSQLRCAADWIRVNTQPGDRVVLLGRDDLALPRRHDADPLLAMSGQVALTLALNQHLRASPGAISDTGDPRFQHRQQHRLTEAASELHQRHPALLGGPVHLAAALAASEPLPSHRRIAVPA